MTLSTKHLDETQKFLQSNSIVWKGKLSREASDGRLIALLLKSYYGKLVDLHNYPAQNNTKLKLYTWETLNYKVFNKLGLKTSKKVLVNLATGKPGEVEKLIYKIMKILKKNYTFSIKTFKNPQEKSEQADIQTLLVEKLRDDQICKVKQKMIAFVAYKEVRDKLKYVEQRLKPLEQKLAHLENLLYLKNEELEEFCSYHV